MTSDACAVDVTYINMCVYFVSSGVYVSVLLFTFSFIDHYSCRERLKHRWLNPRDMTSVLSNLSWILLSKELVVSLSSNEDEIFSPYSLSLLFFFSLFSIKGEEEF